MHSTTALTSTALASTGLTTAIRSSTARRAPALALLAVAALALSGCVPNASATDSIGVTATDDACDVSASETTSGAVTFSITNDGSRVTEFYVLADDRLRIVGEVENIGAGLSRELAMQVPPGDYFTVCKPGMIGDGVGIAAFTVTDSGEPFVTDENTQQLIDEATSSYVAYVRDQSQQLLEGTEEFAAAYLAGDDDAARALYASTRIHWERIETVAESFGDLDPRLDLREADLEEGQAWTGWHAIEKDLWPAEAPGYVAFTQDERQALADQLVADTTELDARIPDLELTIDQIANGAIGLLDEVATGKVTGEEEAWSHTDLWDFQGNVDGALVMFESVRPVLEAQDPDLAATLADEFSSLQALLDEHRQGDGFVLYTELSDDEIRALSDQVNALAEPLSQLTAALVS